MKFGIGGFLLLNAGLLASFLIGSGTTPAVAQSTDPEPGQLQILGKDGKIAGLCPLKGTKVNAQIDGFGARVTVVQTFTNPSKEPIEAVYVFPLPNDAAVDRMRMRVGSRIIEGEIKRREEARRIYDEAKAQGQVASLLDQERPNIFTQSVANIMPGAQVEVEISYVQVLKYEEGEFEFSFPMVVGPRYTANAPDPDKISPPITPKGTRTGANIDLTVNLDAGAPVQEMKSVLHDITTQASGRNGAVITLKKKDEIPNRDFVLRYRTAADTVQGAFLTHFDPGKLGFFTLILMPPRAPTGRQIVPKEVFFVMDQSGSQGGFPIEKSKELTLKLIKTLRPDDTFNVLGFNTSVRSLWPHSRPNTTENLKEAEAFVKAMNAEGGTNILEGMNAALRDQRDPKRLRLVVFNTDGYVGDEKNILDSIQKNRDNAHIFTFGIGNSVNRYLIDSMAVEGKGDAEYVTLAEEADAAVKRFIKRTQTPVLTDVKVAFSGVQVDEALPGEIPDVFSEKPVVLCGRYTAAGLGSVTVSGMLGGRPWARTIDLNFTTKADAPSIPTLWARRKVDEVQRQNYLSSLSGQGRNDIDETITKLGLEYSIMTEFTSFVAVEKRVVNIGGKQRTVAVPVEMADGVSYEGIFESGADKAKAPLLRQSYGLAGSVMGGGGGGYGAANGALPQAKSPGRLRIVHADPSLAATLTGEEQERQMTPAQRRQSRFNRIVDKKLQAAKGKVELQIWLKKTDAATIADLKKLGLVIDETDAGLKVVFGSCDATKLIELAQNEAVVRIGPI